LTRPGTSSSDLAARVRAALAGRHLTVSAGSARGQAVDLTAAADKDNLTALATSAGADVVMIAMFVVAGAVSLSVLQRRRQFALLRAVGASGWRIRRMMLAELA